MKTIVSMQDLRELEIKPSGLLAEYQKLLEKEVRTHWSPSKAAVLNRCPACGSRDIKHAFEKWGVPYAACSQCNSIFASTRLKEGDLTHFYEQSKAVTFWREKMLQATETTRLEKLYIPRCEWILDGLFEYLPEVSTGLDFTPHSSAMLEMLVKNLPSLESYLSAHFLGNEVSKNKVIASKGALYSKPPPKVDFITAFDAFDRVSDPSHFVSAIKDCLVPGGLVFLTATCASGLEIQLLGSHSPSILPPDRLNVFSVEGFRSIFNQKDWEICEISTPGMFDVGLVKQHMKEVFKDQTPRFFDYLLKFRDQDCLDALQEFLQAHLLSSFARLMVRKK